MTVYIPAEVLAKFNEILLKMYPVKKGDKHKIMSPGKLYAIAENVRNEEGDVHDKAAVLLSGLVCEHPFSSGNKRTAFFATRLFLDVNKAEFGVQDIDGDDKERNRKVLTGVREGFYTKENIKNWLKSGVIHEFKRH